MKNEKTTKKNGDLVIKVMMAILAAAVIILTVINSVPAFSNQKETTAGVTSAQNINTDANNANVTYYELLNETVEGYKA